MNFVLFIVSKFKKTLLCPNYLLINVAMRRMKETSYQTGAESSILQSSKKQDWQGKTASDYKFISYYDSKRVQHSHQM